MTNQTTHHTSHQPGHRTADRTADLPSQITLPGQAATPDGPLDMTMMYVMHHAFRRDLRLLTLAAERTPLGDRATWRALADRWALFAYVLHHHHSGEDVGYWPLLLERADAAQHDTLHAMEAEHEGIDPLLTAARGGFSIMAGRSAYTPGEEHRGHLVETLRDASVHLDAHLSHEETDAIPLLHAYITPAEDERIEEEHFRGPVPLRKIVAVVPWAMHELPTAARERVFAATGTAYKIVWLLTRRGFERRDRRALRYV